jgi:hypothetical protein
MTHLTDNPLRDVMQVCQNGHVITDLLRTFPDRGQDHCDRCGAVTLDQCATCGIEIPGAVHVPGFVPVGRSLPPEFCSSCGAAFPWSKRAETGAATDALADLEQLLRRLPRVIRQLRSRHGTRSAFQVADERDLEDLIRALLPILFDEIRPESRTPSYDCGTRTDFRFIRENIVVSVKMVSSGDCEKKLADQLQEDVAYYERAGSYKTLVEFIYDPQGFLRDPGQVESMLSKPQEGLELRCIIAS